jgi:hypothetical protein
LYVCDDIGRRFPAAKRRCDDDVSGRIRPRDDNGRNTTGEPP